MTPPRTTDSTHLSPEAREPEPATAAEASRGPLRVVFVASAEGEERLLESLRRGGYEPSSRRVDLQRELSDALKPEAWDVAICEDDLPTLDGPTALRLIKTASPWLPVIIVSSKFGESVAAAAMKAGADDFVAMGFLARLVPAVEREIRAASMRRGWKESAQSLADVRLRSTAFMDNNPAIAFMKNEEGRLAYVNRTFEKAFRVSFESVRGKTDAQWLPAELAKETRAHDEEVLAVDRPMEFEEDLPAAEGTRRWLVFKFPFRDHSGHRFVGGVGIDITERKRAEEDLRTSEDLYRDLVEHTRALICVHDLEGRILAVNEAAARSLGYDRQASLGSEIQTIRDIMAPETRAGFERYIEQIRARGAVDGIMAVQTRSGEKRFWEYHNTLRTEGVEKPVVRGLAFDVTERLRAQEELRESQAFLEKAQEIGQIGSWISDPSDGGRLVWSRETCRIFGIPEEDFDGRVETFFERVHPDDREAVARERRAAIEHGSTYDLEHRIVRPDGSVRLVHERASIERDPQGRAAKMIGVVQDITDHRQLEDQFRQAQKMEAIGRLAGGVAHDFNNLLTAILGYSDMMLSQIGHDSPLREDAEEIRKAGERAAGLTRQLLAFSRKQRLDPKVIDLNALIGDVQRMLQRMIGEDVELATSLEPSLGRVRADPGQLEQVIMNLAVNARDAMPDGGKLTIETRNAELDETWGAGRFTVQAGSYVMVAVTDTGTGMDEETKSHVFEPFFTTKAQGEGTGLGLATVYGIVKQSGGYVWVYSEPGAGTAFRIYLPRHGDASEEVGRFESPAPEESRRGRETILLVEDEEGVRALARKVLSMKGYEVLEASDAEAALTLLERHAGPIHLLLTDVLMPGLSGPELAARVVARRPEVKVLLMSGYSDSAAAGSAELLQKPFSPEALARKVRETLS
jgi:two-component system cell cycle sensor histidine kinase/response regulator CckA